MTARQCGISRSRHGRVGWRASVWFAADVLRTSFVAGLTPAVWAGAAGVAAVAAVAAAAAAAVLIPAALGRSSEAVVKGALEEAERRVTEPDLVG